MACFTAPVWTRPDPTASVIHGHLFTVSDRILEDYLEPEGEGRRRGIWHCSELLVKTLEKWAKLKSPLTQTLNRICRMGFRIGQAATQLADGTGMQGFQEEWNPSHWSWQQWQLASSAWNQSSLVWHLTQPQTRSQDCHPCTVHGTLSSAY